MKNLAILASLAFAMHTGTASAYDVTCPDESIQAQVGLIAAPYDCTSQVIVDIRVGGTQAFGCLSSDSAKSILSANPEYLASEEDYYANKFTKLLVCLKLHEGKATGESQKRVSIPQILQNITKQNGLILE